MKINDDCNETMKVGDKCQYECADGYKQNNQDNSYDTNIGQFECGANGLTPESTGLQCEGTLQVTGTQVVTTHRRGQHMYLSCNNVVMPSELGSE